MQSPWLARGSPRSAGDPFTAKSKLKSAAGLLYKNGKLDDFERARVMTVAMERLDEDVDLLALYERVLDASRPTGPGGLERGRGAGCRLDRVDATQIDACIEAQVRSLFIELRQPVDEIPDYFYADVGRQLREEREFIQRALLRGAPIIPELEGALLEKKMPPLLHYVALLLALAGYNHGQGQVRAKLRQLDDPFSDRSYWRLVESGLLPEETALYVTRFVAAAIAGEGGVPSRRALVAAGY